MPCPDLGALRASLDDVGDGASAVREHAGACAACRETLAELRRNAELAAPAIALTKPDGDVPRAAVEAALARLERRRARPAIPAAAAAGTVPDPAPPVGSVLELRRRGGPLGWARAKVAGLVAAVLLVGLVATPGGRSATASFLANFRSERFEVVGVDNVQSQQFGDVVGELVGTGVFRADLNELYSSTEPTVTRDLAEAGRLAGFQVRRVPAEALPDGVGADAARFVVNRARTIRATFDRDSALAYFRQHGEPDVRIPERYDGTELIVSVPAVVLQYYPGRDGAPKLIVGQAGTVAIETKGGATLEELRELLLALPGLPEGVVERLRQIEDWRTTLPLPIPTDQVNWKPATVGGAEAISFTDPSGRLNALLWHRGGHIWGVAGVIGADEALDVAGSLG